MPILDAFPGIDLMDPASNLAQQPGRSPCVIVGGGPGGMMLALLLARQGVGVTLLEAHADFDRDFRGDTIHPATLEVLEPAELFGAEDDSDWQGWVEFFSRTREADGRRKGLVELRL